MVSLRAQTAASAPSTDYTTSNAFFVAGVLMVLGTLVPKFARRPRRWGMHN
ncbi:hypothetical protein [Sinomonas albida]|uniref:hypothetical protein n=1 Tax=Sinomonas albida TaxID=369942 RepID=UPI001457BC2A|nr:hypothetical protein [Sinomonas albida]